MITLKTMSYLKPWGRGRIYMNCCAGEPSSATTVAVHGIERIAGVARLAVFLTCT
jgi:hypothetical protein